MTRSIRRVGYAITVLILLLIGQLTYLQVIDADRLADDPANVRTVLRDFNRPRGQILTADGEIVARSVPTAGEFKYQREYPLGDLYPQVSGYQSFVVGSTGTEKTYDRILTGRDTRFQLENIGAVFSGKDGTGNVVLSLSNAAQNAARDALEGQTGSIVALDVKTGEVLAMYSNPTYDPNPLASHDVQVAQSAFEAVNNRFLGEPALARTYRSRYSPGSTFKVVTTIGALDTGTATPDRQFPNRASILLPQTTNEIQNFGGNTCGGSLTFSLQQSCNVTFVELGLDMGASFVPVMNACGVGSAAPPLDIDPGAVPSAAPTVTDSLARFGLAGIGQGDVFTTPLQMALVAAGIGNGGTIMEPHVMREITNADGEVVQSFTPKPWLTCTNPSTAAAVTAMMIGVVQGGTGTAAQIGGVTVAGKTGTAQTGIDSEAPHAWFIAFAPADNPQYAVSVIVEHGGSLGSEATGGAVAAPMARRVLERLLGLG